MAEEATNDKKQGPVGPVIGGVDMSKFMFKPKDPEPVKKEEKTPEEFDPASLSEFEQAQYKKGWRPADVWAAEGHDPDEWRNAKQFSEHGQTLDTISKLRRQVKKVTSQFDAMKQWNEEVETKAYERLQKSIKALTRVFIILFYLFYSFFL